MYVSANEGWKDKRLTCAKFLHSIHHYSCMHAYTYTETWILPPVTTHADLFFARLLFFILLFLVCILSPFLFNHQGSWKQVVSFSFIYEHAIYECIYMYTCILFCIYVYLFMYTCVYSHACPHLHNMDIHVCRSIISITRRRVSNTHLHPPPTSRVLTLPPPLFIYFVYNDFGRCFLLPSFLHVELERNIMPSV